MALHLTPGRCTSHAASQRCENLPSYAPLLKSVPQRRRELTCFPEPRRRMRQTAALPFVEAWNTTVADVDQQTLASNLFASSIIPYSGFLYHLQKSGKAPKVTMFGFYFLLVFVGATIPAGIWAKIHYNTSLSNVDWLHGSAESMLTVTNLLIVLGLRQGLRQAEKEAANRDVHAQAAPEHEKSLP